MIVVRAVRKISKVMSAAITGIVVRKAVRFAAPARAAPAITNKCAATKVRVAQ
jgi:hypothetical protein